MVYTLVAQCSATPATVAATPPCSATPSLRAKGTLLSEPRSSTPCEMRFFPREKGKTAFSRGKTQAIFPFLRGKNRISQGVEDRGSLISVPLALRVFRPKFRCYTSLEWGGSGVESGS